MDEPNNMFELEYELKNILLIMHGAGHNGTIRTTFCINQLVCALILSLH